MHGAQQRMNAVNIVNCMTPADFTARCSALGLHSHGEIAAKFHRDRHTIRRWLTTGADGYPIPIYVEAMLSMLEQEQKERQP